MVVNEILSHADIGDHMGGYGGSSMWLWGVVMMTLVVILIVWFIRAPGTGVTGPARRDPDDRAREILGERFAKGELSPEEYRERVSELD